MKKKKFFFFTLRELKILIKILIFFFFKGFLRDLSANNAPLIQGLYCYFSKVTVSHFNKIAIEEGLLNLFA